MIYNAISYNYYFILKMCFIAILSDHHHRIAKSYNKMFNIKIRINALEFVMKSLFYSSRSVSKITNLFLAHKQANKFCYLYYYQNTVYECLKIKLKKLFLIGIH